MNIDTINSQHGSVSPIFAPAKGRDSASAEKSEQNPLETTPSDSEIAKIRQLKSRDREVRSHEAAHVAAGGSVVHSGAKLSYVRGPDGVLYATGGEVSIDTSPGSTPEATLAKAETIRRAALAPAQPSRQDRAVAADAARMAMQARQEIFAQRQAQADQEFKPSPSRAIGNYQSTGKLETPSVPNIDELI
jgi:SprA-related family